MFNRHDFSAILKSFAVAAIVLTIGAFSLVNAAEDQHTTIALNNIDRLTTEYNKAEKAGNTKKMQYILACLKTEAKVIELQKTVEKESN